MQLPKKLYSSKIYFADQCSILEHIEKFERKIKAIDPATAPQGSLRDYEVMKKNQLVKWRIDEKGIVRYPIQGLLTPDEDLFYWFYDYSTPYSFIESDFKEFKSNPYVKGVLLEVNSGGGEALGYSDAFKSIMDLGKPIIAHSRAWAMSMAYKMACCADLIHASESSRIASIGTIWSQWNMSKLLNAAGIDPIVLRFGEDKGKPRDDEEVSEENYQRMAAWVKEGGEAFLKFVSERRNISLEKDSNGQIPWAEGRHFSPEEALNFGLIDAVSTNEEAYNALLSLIDTGQKPGSTGASNTQTIASNTMKIEEQLKAAQDENVQLKEQLELKDKEISSLKADIEAREKTEKDGLIAQIGEHKNLTASEKRIYEKCSASELREVLSECKAEDKKEEPKEEPKPEEPKEPSATQPASKEPEKVFVGAAQAEGASKEEKKPVLSQAFHNHFRD